jgi:hypothetical protein
VISLRSAAHVAQGSGLESYAGGGSEMTTASWSRCMRVWGLIPACYLLSPPNQKTKTKLACSQFPAHVLTVAGYRDGVIESPDFFSCYARPCSVCRRAQRLLSHKLLRAPRVRRPRTRWVLPVPGEWQSALLASRCGPEMMGAGLHRSHPDHRVAVGSWLRPYSGN